MNTLLLSSSLLFYFLFHPPSVLTPSSPSLGLPLGESLSVYRRAVPVTSSIRAFQKRKLSKWILCCTTSITLHLSPPPHLLPLTPYNSPLPSLPSTPISLISPPFPLSSLLSSPPLVYLLSFPSSKYLLPWYCVSVARLQVCLDIDTSSQLLTTPHTPSHPLAPPHTSSHCSL